MEAARQTVDFKWGLLENALDFIEAALDRLAANKTRADIKYGLLHLCSGIELLFKEALRREHWSLIFDDPDKATPEALKSGDFKSADFDSCLKRLENVACVKLGDTKKNELLNFRRKRNRLEHFGIADSKEAVIASTGNLMSTVVNFVRDQLCPDKWDKSDKLCLERITKKLSDFRAFVDHRDTQIKTALREARKTHTVFVCPSCFQVALVLGGPLAKCLFCRYEAPPDAAAGVWVQTLLDASRYKVAKEGGEYPVHDCPECENETLVDTQDLGSTFDLERYVRFSCGEIYKGGSMSHCDTCGRLYRVRGEDDLGICFACFEDLEHRN